MYELFPIISVVAMFVAVLLAVVIHRQGLEIKAYERNDVSAIEVLEEADNDISKLKTENKYRFKEGRKFEHQRWERAIEKIRKIYCTGSNVRMVCNEHAHCYNCERFYELKKEMK